MQRTGFVETPIYWDVVGDLRWNPLMLHFDTKVIEGEQTITVEQARARLAQEAPRKPKPRLRKAGRK